MPTSGDLVRADRIQLLYLQSLPAVGVSLAAASLLAALLWPAADHRAVMTWLAILVATRSSAISLFVGYRRKAPTGPQLLAWERPYFVTLLASALIWGVGSVWIMPKDSLLHQAMALTILVGMAARRPLGLFGASGGSPSPPSRRSCFRPPSGSSRAGERAAVLLGIGMILFFASALRATKVLSNTLQQNFEMTHELRDAKEVAERLASTDALTGLTNRRAFLDRADAPFHYCRRNGLAAAAIMLDLDHFKHINDTRGHAVGDMALQHVGNLIQSSVRKSDLCCRWGGEEFVIFLPDTSLDEAESVAEKLRIAMAMNAVPVPSGNVAITASCGVAEGHRDLESLIDRADAALYRAKHEGRNRVSRDETGDAGIRPAGQLTLPKGLRGIQGARADLAPASLVGDGRVGQDHRVHEVADRHHPDGLAAIRDQHVPVAVLDHDAKHLHHRFRRRHVADVGAHDRGHGRGLGIAALAHDAAHEVALREDPGHRAGRRPARGRTRGSFRP